MFADSHSENKSIVAVDLVVVVVANVAVDLVVVVAANVDVEVDVENIQTRFPLNPSQSLALKSSRSNIFVVVIFCQQVFSFSKVKTSESCSFSGNKCGFTETSLHFNSISFSLHLASKMKKICCCWNWTKNSDAILIFCFSLIKTNLFVMNSWQVLFHF